MITEWGALGILLGGIIGYFAGKSAGKKDGIFHADQTFIDLRLPDEEVRRLAASWGTMGIDRADAKYANAKDWSIHYSEVESMKTRLRSWGWVRED
jgi:hypothetical protein